MTKNNIYIIGGIVAGAGALVYLNLKKVKPPLPASAQSFNATGSDMQPIGFNRTVYGHIVGSYREPNMYENNWASRLYLSMFGGYEFYGAQNNYVFAKQDSYDWYDPNEQVTPDNSIY